MRLLALLVPMLLLLAWGTARTRVISRRERREGERRDQPGPLEQLRPCNWRQEPESRFVTGEITRLGHAAQGSIRVEWVFSARARRLRATRAARWSRGSPAEARTACFQLRTGRGCDIYLFDFDTSARRSTRRPRAGTQSFLRSVRPQAALPSPRFEHRRGSRGRLPYLYAKRGTHTPRRLPGGGRGTTGLPSPTSLDLNGSRLAFKLGFNRAVAEFTPQTFASTWCAARTARSRASGAGSSRTLISTSIVLQNVRWGCALVAGTGGAATSSTCVTSCAVRRAMPGSNFGFHFRCALLVGTYYSTTPSRANRARGTSTDVRCAGRGISAVHGARTER